MAARWAPCWGARARSNWGIASRMALVEEGYQDIDLCSGRVGRTS